MRKRGVWCLGLGFLMIVGARDSRAGEGLVSLQSADPSCPDSSGTIYVDCANGTVTDNRTGLVWLKNANCLGVPVDWYTAMGFVAGLSDESADSFAATHDCGLADGSSPGEWRLPSVSEWEAMIVDAVGLSGAPDCTVTPPTITNDSGLGCWVSGPSSFTGVIAADYWAAGTFAGVPTAAWGVNLSYAGVGGPFGKNFDNLYVWPVRGGQ
jgi:hypothetical protein